MSDIGVVTANAQDQREVVAKGSFDLDQLAVHHRRALRHQRDHQQSHGLHTSQFMSPLQQVAHMATWRYVVKAFMRCLHLHP